MINTYITKELSSGANAVVKSFNSPEEYQEFLSTIDKKSIRKDISNEGWSGGTWSEVINKLTYGDDTNLAQAEKIIEQMRDAHIFTQHLPILEASVIGYLPNVPATIMGLPKSMFARAASEQEDNTTPLRIFVETTVSARVSQKELTARGIAALAFGLAMNQIRPVEIYAVSAGTPGYNHNVIICTQIASKPLDMLRATWMLTSAGYARQIAFSGMYHVIDRSYDYGVGWCWGDPPTQDRYIKNMREALEMSSDDVLISGGHLYDKAMLTNPVQWVKDMIKFHTEKDQ